MLSVYKKLQDKFGKQGWWPITDAISEKSIYHLNTPRNEQEKLEISLGAILTQNTSWNNAEKAIISLKKEKLISKEKLKKINENKLANLIKSSGYYKQKAKKIKIFVNLKGKLNREKLLNSWGIGPETADSILAYAYNQKIFVVDAYTKRIFSRLGLKENKYDEIQNLVHHTLSSKYFNEFHALLVRLAKDHCKTKPECNNCPLDNVCLSSLT